MSMLATLAIAAAFAGQPAIVSPPATIAATQPATVAMAPPATVATAPRRAGMPWIEINRREIVRAGRPGMARTIAARLGAALAWDLADLPRHQLGASQPWGVFRSPPDLAATTVPLTPGDGGAIGACITRWNTLYPPYALTAMDDVDRPVRQENDPSEEPSCPGN